MQQGTSDTKSSTKSQRQCRRSTTLLICAALVFGNQIMDQKLQAVQVNPVQLSQLSPKQTTQQQPQSNQLPVLERQPPLEDNDSVLSMAFAEKNNSSVTSNILGVHNRSANQISDTVDFLTTTPFVPINNTGVDHSTIPTTLSSESSQSSTSKFVNDTNPTMSNDDDTDDYFHSTNRLPQWFQEYAKWHTETVQHLSIHRNYDDYQYVVLRCVRKDSKCYGAADRLKMIPVIVKLAHLSQRLFFIYWSRPFPLEEFLLPNTNFLNWTVPYHLYESLDVEAVQPIWSLGGHQEYGMLDAASQSQRVLRIRSMTYASQFYDTHPIIRIKTNGTNFTYNDVEDELPMWDVYSDFWRALFVPSSGVRNKIFTILSDLGLLFVERKGTQYIGTTHDSTIALSLSSATQNELIPNMKVWPYISVHVRAHYTHDDSENHPEENAIRCAKLVQEQYKDKMGFSDSNSSSTNSLPIYMASDTSIVTQRGIQYGLDHNLLVVSRDSLPVNANSTTTTTNPYHIDEPPPETEDFVLYASDFYDTFVDLYLLAMGRCHTWGVGGYGSWAAAIAPKEQNPSNLRSDDICPRIIHSKQKC